MNTHLESLSLTNVGLNDKTAQRLADALEKNSTLKVLKCAFYIYSYVIKSTPLTSLIIILMLNIFF